MPSLRIGIDGTCLASERGYGRFLRELLGPLLADSGGHEVVLFLDAATAERVALPDVRVERLATRESQATAASGSGSRSLADLWRMGRGVAAQPLDVFYFPSVFSWFPLPRRLPTAVAIHDTIPERHGDIVFPHRRNRWLWQAKSWAARRQARTVITVSEYARRQIERVLGVPSERIFVTPEAPSPAFRPAEDAGPREAWLRAHGLAPALRYFLFVGGLNPHKNVDGLVRALAALPNDSAGRAPELLLVGSYDRDTFHADRDALHRTVATSGLEGRVHWPGFVPDEALRHLYAGAVATVLPAFEEGFGLPAVEGAACGAPCVATRESPLPEVLAGGGAFFDPHDPAALEAALGVLWSDPTARAAMAAAALERASALSWTETARATRRALEATAEATR